MTKESLEDRLKKYSYFQQRAVYTFLKNYGGLQVTSKGMQKFTSLHHDVALRMEEYEQLGAMAEFKKGNNKEFKVFLFPNTQILIPRQARLPKATVLKIIEWANLSVEQFLDMYEEHYTYKNE